MSSPIHPGLHLTNKPALEAAGTPGPWHGEERGRSRPHPQAEVGWPGTGVTPGPLCKPPNWNPFQTGPCSHGRHPRSHTPGSPSGPATRSGEASGRYLAGRRTRGWCPPWGGRCPRSGRGRGCRARRAARSCGRCGWHGRCSGRSRPRCGRCPRSGRAWGSGCTRSRPAGRWGRGSRAGSDRCTRPRRAGTGRHWHRGWRRTGRPAGTSSLVGEGQRVGHKGLPERRSQASSRPRGQLPGTTEEPAWHGPNSIISLVPRTPWQDVAIFPWTDTEVPRMHDWQGEVASRPDPVCPSRAPCSVRAPDGRLAYPRSQD